jgi:predicted O-methyltransferase YrrM
MQISESAVAAGLDIDARSLKRDAGRSSARFAGDLYAAYRGELAELAPQMAARRARMLADGYAADFSDRESEMLYMLVRALRPQTVVEMSPCHGYSTNYILAALTQNGAGRLDSYEIVTEIHGKPIEAAIRGNLIDGVDQSRFSLHIGDASKGGFPECDFAFIDSNHEAWFAAWFLDALVPKAKVCMVHDIVIEQNGALIPKAPFLGIREPHQVLQSLADSGQKLAALCVMPSGAERAGIAPRHDLRDRSIVFAGHGQSDAARANNRAQRRLTELFQLAIVGDRETALDEGRAIAADGRPYATLCGGLLFALMGYRIGDIRAGFPDVYAAVQRAAGGPLSMAEFNAALELGARAYAPDLIRTAVGSAQRSGLDAGAIATLLAGYRPQSYAYPYQLARVANAIGRRFGR